MCEDDGLCKLGSLMGTDSGVFEDAPKGEPRLDRLERFGGASFEGASSSNEIEPDDDDDAEEPDELSMSEYVVGDVVCFLKAV